MCVILYCFLLMVFILIFLFLFVCFWARPVGRAQFRWSKWVLWCACLSWCLERVYEGGRAMLCCLVLGVVLDVFVCFLFMFCVLCVVGFLCVGFLVFCMCFMFFWCGFLCMLLLCSFVYFRFKMCLCRVVYLVFFVCVGSFVLEIFGFVFCYVN